MIIEMVNVANSSDFQKLEDESKRRVLKELISISLHIQLLAPYRGIVLFVSIIRRVFTLR